jgi:DNA-binding response OmpR family regulator
MMTVMPNTILIIDDRVEIRVVLTRLLAMEGYQVSAAENGQEGLTLAQKSNPAITFVDLSLPDLSGWDVAQIIKNANRQARVILMTGWGYQLNEAKTGRRSVDFILRKPFDFNEVLDILALLSAME